MFRVVRAALLGWGLTALAVLADPAEPIAYSVTPGVNGGALQTVDVSLAFQGDADGRTEVILPTEWSGARRLDQTVIEASAEGARLRRRGERLTLRHAPSAQIRLTYRVRQDYAGPPRVGFDRPYRPSTQADGFTLVGWTLFARVAGRDDQPVTFRWGAAPQDWTLASDLDHAAGAPISAVALNDSVLVGGSDLSLVSIEAAGGPVRVAIHGRWRFAPEDLAERYARIVEQSSAFWGDGGRPYFLALTPLAGPMEARAQSGLGLGDGLAVWLTANLDLDEAHHVIVHEQQHAWLPDRVGGLTPGAGEVRDFWFSEGFTDFYTLRTALRLGLNSPEDHIAALDRALMLQARTPPALRNADVARAFFSDPRVAGVPYHRGLLLALRLDERLRAYSGGDRDLDDVLLAMRSGRGSAPQRLIQTYGDLGGGDLGPDLFHHVDLGEPIRLAPDLFGGCATIRDEGGRQTVSPGPALAGPAREACIRRLAGL